MSPPTDHFRKLQRWVIETWVTFDNSFIQINTEVNQIDSEQETGISWWWILLAILIALLILLLIIWCCYKVWFLLESKLKCKRIISVWIFQKRPAKLWKSWIKQRCNKHRILRRQPGPLCSATDVVSWTAWNPSLNCFVEINQYWNSIFGVWDNCSKFLYLCQMFVGALSCF